MPINIHGKQYKTVAERVNEFRQTFQSWTLSTEMVANGDAVIVKASVLDDTGRLISTGYAEEVRGSTNINKTSALENCETSALGRALAAFGLAGTEYASANEVSNAIIQQEVMNATEGLVAYSDAVRKNFGVINSVKVAIANSNRDEAMEWWNDLDEETKSILWKAPKNGGIFTTEERRVMKGG